MEEIETLLIKEINSRGMPETNALDIVMEFWRTVVGVDDQLHNGKRAMLDFWLNYPIKLVFFEDHDWGAIDLDKDVYVA